MASFSRSVTSVSEASTRSSLALWNKVSQNSTASGSIKVQEKLRKLDQNKNVAGSELKELADKLSDPGKIMCEFNSVLDPILQSVIEEAEADDPTELLNEAERTACRDRQRQRYIKINTIPLSLFIRDLNVPANLKPFVQGVSQFLSLDWGAKHVSLVIGNVLVEWGCESLVIPQIVSEATSGEVLYISDKCPHNIEAIQNLPDSAFPLSEPAEEVRALKSAMETVKEKFGRLSELVVKYNTTCYYDPVGRNCQQFVRDALTCFGMNKKPESSQDDKEFSRLRKIKDKDIPAEFSSHAKLDEFITDTSPAYFHRLKIEDLTYLKMCYSRFHGALPCHLQSCALPILEQAYINQRTSINYMESP